MLFKNLYGTRNAYNYYLNLMYGAPESVRQDRIHGRVLWTV